MLSYRPLLLLTLLTLPCALPAQDAESTWRDPSPHAVRLIEVEKDVQLEVLDWGGTGRAVILLAGLGNTAHVFDRFALQLNEDFHVYGVTRRGFGESSKPQAGYDVGRLTEDLAAVIAALGVQRPIVIGHSFAGDELTELAVRYPKMTGALIYLDAAADRTAPVPVEYTKLFRTLPPAGPPQTQAYASFAAMAEYAKQPESEVRQRFRQNAEGKLASRVEPRVIQAIVAGIKRPAYASVSVPALAFFAIPASPKEFFPWIVTDDPVVLENMTTLHEMNLANVRRQIAMFDDEVVESRVIELLGASHNIFVSNEADVLMGIREFVDSQVSKVAH